jgi:hypothetical protein
MKKELLFLLMCTQGQKNDELIIRVSLTTDHKIN